MLQIMQITVRTRLDISPVKPLNKEECATPEIQCNKRATGSLLYYKEIPQVTKLTKSCAPYNLTGDCSLN